MSAWDEESRASDTTMTIALVMAVAAIFTIGWFAATERKPEPLPDNICRQWSLVPDHPWYWRKHLDDETVRAIEDEMVKSPPPVWAEGIVRCQG